tara:strand:- start:219 stop:890 length:672 start_codon:yes stop_codon:yes gene_type:complete
MNLFTEIPASKRSLAQRKLIHGVGINDANYIIQPLIDGKQTRCHFYVVWKSMIERCYSKKFQEKNPTYMGCSVAKEWLTFSSFRQWMEARNWVGLELDKDILVSDNKVYSQETCMFVSSQINTLLSGNATKRGKYPQGIYWHKKSGKFIAQCNVGGRKRYLGLFSTQKEAEYTYLIFKAGVIEAFSSSDEVSKDERLSKALMAHSYLFIIKADALLSQLENAK